MPCQGFCHGRGHLEPYVTGVAATRIAQELFGPAADSYRLVRLANEGDEQAREALAGIGHRLGAGIASLCNVFGTTFVVIGGGFGVSGFEWLVPAALEAAKRDALDAAGETVADRACGARDDGGPVGRRAAGVRRALMLSVCATPIGNLEDVTLRVLRELREADVVLCEDTRHTRVLLERHDIRATLLSYHEHNEAKRTAEMLPRLLAGERVALVSDAGMPGISDPGARLIAAALEAGVQVTVLPGPVGGRDSARRRAGSSASATSSSATCPAARRRLRRCGASSCAGRGRSSLSSRHSGCLVRCARWRPSCPRGPSRSAAS